MKVLVQNCHNHLYLKTVTEWTTNSEEAKLFKSSGQAIQFCSEHQIPTVQIVLKFENQIYDVPIPITDECRDLPEKQHAGNAVA